MKVRKKETKKENRKKEQKNEGKKERKKEKNKERKNKRMKVRQKERIQKGKGKQSLLYFCNFIHKQNKMTSCCENVSKNRFGKGTAK